MAKKTAPPTAPKTGPAFELVKLAYKNGGKSPSSERAANRGCHLALRTAIEGGVRWTLDDAAEIVRAFPWTRGQYRFYVDDGIYALAVGAHNESACRSIERHLGRRPWLWPFASASGDGPGRIAIGSHVSIDGLAYKVTSMTDERLIVCHYERKPDGREGAPKKRVTLTRAHVDAFLAAAAPAEVPEVPKLCKRYEAVFPTLKRGEGSWDGCRCEDGRDDPCRSCRSLRRQDLAQRTALLRAARSARWRRVHPSLANLDAEVVDDPANEPAPPALVDVEDFGEGEQDAV